MNDYLDYIKHMDYEIRNITYSSDNGKFTICYYILSYIKIDSEGISKYSDNFNWYEMSDIVLCKFNSDSNIWISLKNKFSSIYKYYRFNDSGDLQRIRIICILK